jgi:3'(2'), 5'-bisphosphate nucleotidase
MTKDDRSPVTVADFASQALVGYLLGEAFPNDPLVAEEDSTTLRSTEEHSTLEQVTKFVAWFTPEARPVTTEMVCAWIDRGNAQPSPRFWTLDPIDGTKGFLRGDQYAVALALIVDGRVQIGVLGCPNLTEGYLPEVGGPGALAFAVRGKGTWVGSLEDPKTNFTQVHVSGCQHPVLARLLRSFESGHTNLSQVDRFAQRLGVEAEPVSMDSQAKYSVLAAGWGEVYLRLLSPQKPDYKEKIWDQAAGSLLVEEAGGRVSDLDSKPLDFTTGRTLCNNRGVLVTNGHLHSAALKALREIGA